MNQENHTTTLMDKILTWRQGHVGEQAWMFCLALATGIITGAAAHLLKSMIGWVSRHLCSVLLEGGINWWLLVFPLAGIILTGIFQRYVLHRKIYHCVDRMQQRLNTRHYRYPFVMTIAPMFASTLTLGFGGSAGSEGPIAGTGAAIGSTIGQRMHLNPSLMRVLIACGASAGIAGIFKSPIGGALFSLEVLSLELSTFAVAALLVASVSAALTAYVLSGCTPDMVFAQETSMTWQLVPWVVVLGVFCGLYSVYYSTIMSRMERFYDSLSSPWIKNLISGAIVSVLVFLFPVLYGEGYGFMDKVLDGDGFEILDYSLFHSAHHAWVVIALFGGVLLVKAFACCSTNSGGGVAGDFAPTLFAGCIAGFFMAALVNTLFDTHLPENAFAFMGMAAVMAGAIRAPFMAIFITVEMVQSYQMLLPVVLVAAVSYSIVRLFHPVALPHKLS